MASTNVKELLTAYLVRTKKELETAEMEKVTIEANLRAVIKRAQELELRVGQAQGDFYTLFGIYCREIGVPTAGDPKTLPEAREGYAEERKDSAGSVQKKEATTFGEGA